MGGIRIENVKTRHNFADAVHHSLGYAAGRHSLFYTLAIVATTFYFVPELRAFKNSPNPATPLEKPHGLEHNSEHD